MKTGFTTIKKHIPKLENYCDRVIYIPRQEMTSQVLLDFVTEHAQAELITWSYADIGLQLIQLHPVLALLQAQNKLIHFLNNLEESAAQNAFIFQLAEYEKAIMSERARISAAATVASGKTRGRKRLPQAQIDKIQQLYREKKTIREIAAICDVSPGTVFNYTRKAI